LAHLDALLAAYRAIQPKNKGLGKATRPARKIGKGWTRFSGMQSRRSRREAFGPARIV